MSIFEKSRFLDSRKCWIFLNVPFTRQNAHQKWGGVVHFRRPRKYGWISKWKSGFDRFWSKSGFLSYGSFGRFKASDFRSRIRNDSDPLDKKVSKVPFCSKQADHRSAQNLNDSWKLIESPREILKSTHATKFLRIHYDWSKLY